MKLPRHLLQIPWKLALGIPFALCASNVSQAQLGHVVSVQKISENSGGFGGELEEQDQFGRSIVNLGDLNDDGTSDLMVSTHTADDGRGLDRGGVWILFMAPNGFVLSEQRISEEFGNFSGYLDPNDQFGRSAAALGDLDGDGVEDLAVSANYDDDGATNAGAIYILFLNTDGTVKAVQKISQTQGGFTGHLDMHDEFGRSISNIGDLDDDGVVDLLVGSPLDDDGGQLCGAAYVLFLRANGTVKAFHKINKTKDLPGLIAGDWFGFCSTGLGDFDGDGVEDVAVGAVLDDDGGINQGALWLLFLRPDGSVKRSVEIAEGKGGFAGLMDDIDQFGTSVTSLGDLDGDGIGDIAVGAVKDDDGGPVGDTEADVGAVYVLFLNADGTVKSQEKISDLYGDFPQALDVGDWFGCALARLGGSPLDPIYNVSFGARFDNDGGGNNGAIYLVQLNDGTAPVAQFSANPVIGSAPLTVSFSDQSTGQITNHQWNFSDGGPNSQQQNPVRTFTQPGNYSIRLDVRGPKGVDKLLRKDFITVTGPGYPTAEFTATPTSGAAPLSVNFTDTSTGIVTSWAWDFGDGGTSNVQNPAHVFANPGLYTVTLSATGPVGTDNRVRTDYVLVTNGGPVANILVSASSGEPPLTVLFTDVSTGEITSRLWDFGDGATSTQRNPTHVYTEVGTYTIALTVVGPGGTDTLTLADEVSVNEPAPVAAFTGSPRSGFAPLEVAFTDQSTLHVTSWAWDFGDGATSTEAEPTHVFGPGVHDVSLTVTSAGGADVEVRTAFVTASDPTPVASFTAAPTNGVAPLAVTFDDLSTGDLSSWWWDFGDGATSSQREPAHVYATPGTYTVALTAGGPSGSDVSTSIDLVSVGAPPPDAAFAAAPTSGFAPLAVAFTDQSSAYVTSWAWDFGDGTTSNEASPTHVFGPGVFSVSLTVTNSGGADTLVRTNLVTAVDPMPVAGFGAAPTSGIAPLGVSFTDLSTGEVTSWSWTFGDGATSSLRNPSHVYVVPGLYTVSLQASGPAGSNLLTRVGLVTVGDPAPVADFSASPTSGVAPLAVAFQELCTGNVTAWSWTFGDGASSSQRTPTHAYSQRGTYTVQLTATGPGGSDLETKVGYVTVANAPPVADFGATPASGTAPLSVSFNDTSTGTVTGWTWNFGDGTGTSVRNPTHVFSAPGTYTVSLTARNQDGADVETKAGLIVVSLAPPIAAFGASPTSGPAPLSVSFTDSSTGTATGWTWDFGDGTGASVRHPTHVYAAPGTYTVTLTARNAGGSDGETKASFITVRDPAPVADFSASPTSGVAPLSTAFQDLCTGNVTAWSWTFGDGASSSQRTPTHAYSQRGTYTVQLSATGPGGSDLETKVGYVTVAGLPPVADFVATPTSGIAPLTVTFSDASTESPTSWTWDFGDGTGSALRNPSHVYSAPGTYTVRLVARNADGTDAETKNALIVVSPRPPIADFTATPSTGVAPLSVAFSDASTGAVTGWTWDFGDGTGASVRNPTHVYAAPGTYTVTQTARNAGGSDGETKASLITVREPAPVAAFGANPTSGTIPLSVAFSDASTGTVTGWTWDFGDGTSSAARNPAHVYLLPGSYTVTLTARNAGGSDGETKPNLITAQVLAPVAAFGAAPTSGTAPLGVTFSDASTGLVTGWTWDFGDGTGSGARNPVHAYTAPGTYSVTLTARNLTGSDGETKTGLITVNPRPPVANFGATPASGTAPLSVSFNDTSTGAVTGWTWDFGDGTGASVRNPTHVYGAPGTYTATLTARNPGGSDGETKTNLITAREPAPIAAFGATPTSGPAPLDVSFSDGSTGAVTAWSWDFGDGASSSDQDPDHVYADPGVYTVTLTASGPGGSDAETLVALVSVSEPPPVADFSAAPRVGYAPLRVAFRDLSGAPNGVWDFGDGTGANVRNPAHVYPVPGTYDVKLTVTGPGGTDVELKQGCVTVLELPTFTDGSFESQIPGFAPGTPWTVLPGSMVIIAPTGANADGRMPSQGALWCEIGADGTVGATPPTNPGGAGALPRNTAGIRQDFRFDPSASHFAFDAAFVLAEAFDSPNRNDFMSVDVSDATTTRNLFYADSFSDFPGFSSAHGLPMTATETVHVDLAQLFPSATSTTVLTLHVSVGNDGNGARPSKGYVDRFVLARAATAVVRNGSGANAVRYGATPARLGSPWTATVDATGHPRAFLDMVVAYDAPRQGLFVRSGELLTDVTAHRLFMFSWPSTGGADQLSVPIPLDLDLLGLFAASQGMILGGGFELLNAVDLQLGF